jgi:hypothetical protein
MRRGLCAIELSPRNCFRALDGSRTRNLSFRKRALLLSSCESLGYLTRVELAKTWPTTRRRTVWLQAPWVHLEGLEPSANRLSTDCSAAALQVDGRGEVNRTPELAVPNRAPYHWATPRWVSAAGFAPAASCSQSRRSTGLSYALIYILLFTI